MNHFEEELKQGVQLDNKQSGLKRFFKRVFNKEASKVTKEERRRAIVNLEIQDIEDSESRNGKSDLDSLIIKSSLLFDDIELLSSEMGQ
jgi:hypothetical protein